ncbi:Phosphatidate phosphatase [Bertholletia excelsa]
MYAVGRLGSYISRGVYTVSGSLHPFGGAVDIIVVEQPDGSFKSSPWYVRFGKFQGVLKAKEKVVHINVNGVEAKFHMYLDQRGEAYFLPEENGDEDDSEFYPSFSGQETKRDISNGQIVARTSSRRSRILGLVFGRKSAKENRGEVRTASLEHAEIAADLLDDFGVEMSCLGATHIIEMSGETGLDNADNEESALNFQEEVFLPCSDVSDEKSGGDIVQAFQNDETSSNSFANNVVTETHTQVLKLDQENVSVQEVESCAISTISHLSGTSSEVEDKDYKRGGATSFWDIDDFSARNDKYVESIASNNLSVTEEGSEAVIESCSASIDFTQENMENGVEYLKQKSTIVSDHIDIPKGDKLLGEDLGRMAESLPDLWSPLKDLDVQNLRHPLGHSLDSNSDSPRWFPLRDDNPICAEPDLYNEGKSSQAQAPQVGNLSKSIDSSNDSWRVWPFSLRRSKSTEASQPVQGSAESSLVQNSQESFTVMDGENNVLKPKANKKEMKSLTPTSEQLASLNLKEGMNTVVFTFSTSMLGTQQVDARIFLWKWNTRIVISDVDGTITKSDVLGQFMPLVGMDWSQTGVTRLFSAIKENGYQLLFLSARAISQAYITRQFLFNLKQDGKALPDGPVVISPDGLFPSLFREVIRRAPHEFKIACLEDIKACFPPDYNPFYAGFGNRDTDEFSYLKVGIPKGKIFTINPKGEVAWHRLVNTKSYSSLHDLVHDIFPPKSSSEQEDFNSWNFWRLPLPAIEQ